MKKIVAIAMFAYASAMTSTVLAQSDVVREDVDGITNFAHIETTVACAGAITPESVAEIKRMGFGSIINLRRASEEGANIDAEAAAADEAGIPFIHLPFGGNPLDPAVADRFLEVITDPGTEPAFIHCAGGGRAAMMWMLKRVVVDEWDVERALEEATALGLRPDSGLRDFALEYLEARSG
jgi:uncharacterized protein (TIGR01244 family)